MRNYQPTSREAYDSMKPISGKLDMEIMRALEDHPEGITCQDIEDYIRRDHQAVSGNLRHLVENGHAKASGRFGQTRSGRRAILWIVQNDPPPAFVAEPTGQFSMF